MRLIENFKPKFSKKPIKIIGCGLAGAEVAFILANHGFNVHIFDVLSDKPKQSFDYYDKYQNFMLENMKFELEELNSPLLSLAKRYDFKDFGRAYNADFMRKIRDELESNNKISVFDAEIDRLNDTETTIIATGHRTTKEFLKELEKIVGENRLCFYDSEKMVLDASSVDLSKLNFVTENECYANLTEQEYKNLNNSILDFDERYIKPLGFEDEKQITIESVARWGEGGLKNFVLRPRFDEKFKPYASLKMTYNKFLNILILDDFCTAFDEEEQGKLLKNIDALQNAKVLKYSSVKRKTFLLSPACLNDNLQVCEKENLYVCGGFSGTAGSFEGLLMANLCAYSVISVLQNRHGVDFLRQNTCISQILDNIIKKSVIKFRLFNLKYDIINSGGLENFEKEVERQKHLSKTQIENFKEKFYGKYF